MEQNSMDKQKEKEQQLAAAEARGRAREERERLLQEKLDKAMQALGEKPAENIETPDTTGTETPVESVETIDSGPKPKRGIFRRAFAGVADVGKTLAVEPLKYAARGFKEGTKGLWDKVFKKEAEEEIEKLSKQDREKIAIRLSTIGFAVEEKKNNFFAGVFDKIVSKNKNDRGTVARFCSELRDFQSITANSGLGIVF